MWQASLFPLFLCFASYYDGGNVLLHRLRRSSLSWLLGPQEAVSRLRERLGPQGLEPVRERLVRERWDRHRDRAGSQEVARDKAGSQEVAESRQRVRDRDKAGSREVARDRVNSQEVAESR